MINDFTVKIISNWVNLLLVDWVIAIFLKIFKILIWVLIPWWCLHLRLTIPRFMILYHFNRGWIVIDDLDVSLWLQRHNLAEGWWHVSRLPFFNYGVFSFIFPFIRFFLLILGGNCSRLSCVEWLINELVGWELSEGLGLDGYGDLVEGLSLVELIWLVHD